MTQIDAKVEGYRHGRVPREVRERQVLQLAEELFAERGFAGASMDELSRRAGVSKPVIYDLVGSKEELFRRCVERAGAELAEDVMAAMAGRSDPADQFRAGGIAFFRFMADHRGSFDVLFREEGGSRFAPEASGIRRRQTELVSAVLASRAAEFGVRVSEQQVDAVAHALNGAFEALAIWWREQPDVTPEELTDWLMALVMPGLQRFTGAARS